MDTDPGTWSAEPPPPAPPSVSFHYGRVQLSGLVQQTSSPWGPASFHTLRRGSPHPGQSSWTASASPPVPGALGFWGGVGGPGLGQRMEDDLAAGPPACFARPDPMGSASRVFPSQAPPASSGTARCCLCSLPRICGLYFLKGFDSKHSFFN